MVKKILVVDDSKILRTMIIKILKKMGHEVIGEAENGQLGFEAYKSLKPDLVLSDIEMPVMDGDEMLKKIIEFDSDAKVVIISSVANAQLIQRIISDGAIDTIKKPVNEEKLQNIFDKLN